MASIPNNIVAKDSGGNIKKIDLTELLQNYVRNDDIQNILSANWPDCVQSANLSFVGMDDAEVGLDSPYILEAINLTTVGYGSSNVVYERQFSIDRRLISTSTDSYQFSISELNVPFGVCSTRKCFLVLSLEGYENIGVNTTINEAECRELGTHGGNPIILDWASVSMAEGGSFKFAFKDPAKPIGILGELTLSNRIGNVGNIHTYNVKLDFIVCGATAWKNIQEANHLILATEDTAGNSIKSTVDLSSLFYPHLAEIGVIGQSSSERKLSKSSPSKLSFDGQNGISVNMSKADERNASVDERVISISMDMDSIVGEGLAYENGKLSALEFIPADGMNDAIGGFVPSATADQFNNVLTASGWKTFEEIGLNYALQPFIGASRFEDGEEGIVPKPLTTDNDLFLKGDGTWSGAVTVIDGEMNCQYAPLAKEVSIGIGLCNADGEWICPTIQCVKNVLQDGSAEGMVEIDIPFEDVHGVSLCSPCSESIPMSLGDNINAWIANKTIWSESKAEHFFAVFNDGCSASVWMSEAQDDDQSTSRTVLHYIIYGPNCPTQRKITLLVQNVQSERQIELEAGQDAYIDLDDSSNVKVWPSYFQNSMLHEEASPYGSNYNSSIESESDLPDLPWGGRIWVDSNRSAMLSSGRLTYIGDSSTHTVSASVRYAEHPTGTPTLVYGFNPTDTFWDIISASFISYNDEAIAENEIVGHVWIDNGVVKAVSKLFVNWSIQVSLEASNEPIMLEPSNDSEGQLAWLIPEETPVFVPGLILEVSKTDSRLHFHAPTSDEDDWPQSLSLLRLNLDYGLNSETISMNCLSSWLNGRLEAHDKAIVELERNALLSSNAFSGATEFTNGAKGLVPTATPEDRNRVLMGDGTWSEITTTPFSGASSGNGTAGLVPAPQTEDAGKYLCGDGTWSYPTANFNSISGISLNEIDGQPKRVSEVDLSGMATLQDINVLLQADPTRTLYIQPNGTVSSVMPNATSFAIQLASIDGQATIHIQEISDGEAISDSTFLVEAEESHGQLAGQANEIVLVAIKDANTGNVSISSVNIYGIERSSIVSGLKLDFTNTISGEQSSSILDLLYQGASEFSNAVSGLVPPADASEKNWFLRGDGTWQRIDLYQGATISDPGIEGLVPPASTSERGMFLRGDGTWRRIESYDVYQGATSESNGVAGLVPPALSNQRELFLSGDGTWKQVENYDIYQGATSSNAGIAGLVPSASSNQRSLFLAGDGTWKQVATYQGATSSNAGIAGLVPSALSAQRGMFLRGDGTWQAINVYQGATASDDGIAGLVPSAHSYERELFLSGDGTWKQVAIYQGATAENDGVIGLVPAATSEERELFLSGDGNWKQIPIYRGATASDDGIAGSVPPAMSEDKEKFLAGDGTWKQTPVYRGATVDNAGVSGTVPAAESAERKKVLRGDATWSQLVVVTTEIPEVEDDGDIFFCIDED